MSPNHPAPPARSRPTPEDLAARNADLEAFVHGVVHDLREPLRSIRLITEFMREDAPSLPGAVGSRVQRLGELAARAEAMIGALLSHTRAGFAEPVREPVSLGDLVREVAATLPRHAGTVEAVGPLPTLSCDRGMVRRVLLALCSNGLRFNSSPEKRVQIGVLPGTEPPTVFVRDNGIGIDPRRADAAFRMFGRIHPREQFGDGIGAGLTIAKSLVERHGGRIWFEPGESGGTTFLFTLGPAGA